MRAKNLLGSERAVGGANSQRAVVYAVDFITEFQADHHISVPHTACGGACCLGCCVGMGVGPSQRRYRSHCHVRMPPNSDRFAAMQHISESGQVRTSKVWLLSHLAGRRNEHPGAKLRSLTARNCTPRCARPRPQCYTEGTENDYVATQPRDPRRAVRSTHDITGRR